jgi:hypothetical protein
LFESFRFRQLAPAPEYQGIRWVHARKNGMPVDVHPIWNQQSKFNRTEIAFREVLPAAIRDLPVDRRPPT